MKTKRLLATVLCLLLLIFCTSCIGGNNCNHQWGEWSITKNATCTEEGSQECKCFECGKTKRRKINALGHDWMQATCSMPKTCKNCSATEGEPTEHRGEQIWIKRLKTHYRVYSCCSSQILEEEEHTIVDGVCTTCGFNPLISVTSVEVMPGDTQVTITMSIIDNPGIAGLMLSLQYNMDIFNLTEVQSGDAFDCMTFSSPENFDSGCIFLWDSIEVKDENIKDGVFLSLTFDLLSNDVEGEYTLLLKVNAYDNKLTPFTLLIKGGNITIKNN